MLRRKPTPVAAVYPDAVDAPSKSERAFGHVSADALIRVAAVLALFLLCLTNGSSARADSDTCLAKAASFITELDELFEKQQYSMRPHHDLMKKYFSLRDCETEALLDTVRQLHFIRSIYHHSRTNEYIVRFERGNLEAWFAYRVLERKSAGADAGFMRKP